MTNFDSLRLARQLQQHHDRQLAICNALEEIADSLPNRFNKQNALSIARSLYPVVKLAHQFEENDLFPYMVKHYNDHASLISSLERLRFEHWEDESYAEELTECIFEFANNNQSEKIDALSYMIRGFFEGLKRHMAFEAEHLIPLLKA